MKGATLLVASLTAYLVQTAIVQNYLDLLQACDGLTVDSNTGVLSGECQAGKDPALTSVDLNECLGWGPVVDPGHIYSIMPDSPVNALIPVEDGNFTRNCGPCYIIKRDEGGQDAAQLMCSCSPEGSDFKTEYTLDLTNVVHVTNKGCLECMGASGDCAPEVPLNPSMGFDPGDLDNDGFNNVEELIEWLQLRAEAERTPCEQHITTTFRLLPEPWVNTTHHRCKEDHSLCCYQTHGFGCKSGFEAFQLIEGNNYWYRMHYTISIYTLKIENLSRIFQLCKFPGQCDEESENDDTSGVANCTHNPLVAYENRIYDNGNESLSSQIYATTLLSQSTAETTLPSPTSADLKEAASFQTMTTTRNKKQTD